MDRIIREEVRLSKTGKDAQGEEKGDGGRLLVEPEGRFAQMTPVPFPSRAPHVSGAEADALRSALAVLSQERHGLIDHGLEDRLAGLSRREAR